jgi:hypothetical protein
MLFSVSMFPIGSGDSLSHPVADVIGLEGAIADVDRELGRIVAR